MNRYINADKLMKDGWSLQRTKYGLASNTYEVMGLDHVPIADVRENIKGKWQPIEVQPYFKKHFDTSVACSICYRKGNKRWNFCPNCGADMRGKV